MYDTRERVRRAQRAARRYLHRQEQRALRRLCGLCGATLLSESAGGYVFVGVAAFTAASALTLLCMRVHEKEKRDKEKNKESKKEDTP